MNSLFRNIKENIDLDKLEESDDEDEFENISDDKYVDLNKSFKMKCIFLKNLICGNLLKFLMRPFLIILILF